MGLKTEHIGIVSGLADLANFLAVLRERGIDMSGENDRVRTILFGQPVSLPDDLQSEFFQVVRDAFPFVDATLAPPERVGVKEFNAVDFALPWPRPTKQRRVGYGNGIHKEFHQSFYQALDIDEFFFFDNGLSSYADHGCNVAQAFEAHAIPKPQAAYLSLHPPLPLPGYLAFAPQHSLLAECYTDVFGRFRSVARAAPRNGWLPEHVIIGTSLFRTGRISWDEEREIYLRAINSIRKRHAANILFKAHPRASERPLITTDDNVDVLDSSVPIEAFAKPGAVGRAYSISSASLFTLSKFFGWSAIRVETPETRRLLDASPHLKLTNSIPALHLNGD